MISYSLGFQKSSPLGEKYKPNEMEINSCFFLLLGRCPHARTYLTSFYLPVHADREGERGRILRTTKIKRTGGEFFEKCPGVSIHFHWAFLEPG
jgi:hypothetical protein